MDRRSWLARLVASALLLAGPLAGDATAQLPTAPRIAGAQRVARVIFGNVCGGQVSVSSAPLQAGEAGSSTWSAPTLGSPPATYTNCVVVVDNHDIRDAVLCAVVVHEYGHLAGLEHSANPRSIMYPRINHSNIPARCR